MFVNDYGTCWTPIFIMFPLDFQKCYVWQFDMNCLIFKKTCICGIFLVSLNLKCYPFIGKRSEMLGKEGHGILQFEVALKGKKDNLPKKETSFFHHVLYLAI